MVRRGSCGCRFEIRGLGGGIELGIEGVLRILRAEGRVGGFDIVFGGFVFNSLFFTAVGCIFEWVVKI